MNKSDDAGLAVAFVAAYAIRLHGVYSTFGLSENLEQLVYPFFKKKTSVPCDSGLVCDASRCVEMKRIVRTIVHQLLPLEKKNKENKKETTDWGNVF